MLTTGSICSICTLLTEQILRYPEASSGRVAQEVSQLGRFHAESPEARWLSGAEARIGKLIIPIVHFDPAQYIALSGQV